jgi:SAM-dependent methyltransferase
LRRFYHSLTARRSKGISEEIAFWDTWIRTQGFTWPDDFKQRLDPATPLAGLYHSCIDHLDQHKVNILDVGAGPFTVLGKQHPTKQLHITATDVLAAAYDELLGRHQISPPVRTIYADAEHLTAQFSSDYFDFVHAQNSLDHMQHPLRAISEMLSVVKPNCFVLLVHKINEGENQNYKGLHQWNFATDGSSFLIRGRVKFINVTQELSPIADIHCDVDGDLLNVRIQKLRTVAVNSEIDLKSSGLL